MLDEYSGANVFNLSLFAGLVMVTSIVVILIYGWLYGFNFLGQQVVGASRVMLAAHTAPQGAANAGTAPFPTQPAFTYGQGLLNPAPQAGLYGYGYTQRVVTGANAGQYLCPVHEAVGLPNFDTNGIPHCPICGQCMGFSCMSANSVPQMVGRNTAPNLFNPVQGQVGMGNTPNPATAAAFNRGAGWLPTGQGQGGLINNTNPTLAFAPGWVPGGGQFGLINNNPGATTAAAFTPGGGWLPLR